MIILYIILAIIAYYIYRIYRQKEDEKGMQFIMRKLMLNMSKQEKKI